VSSQSTIEGRRFVGRLIYPTSDSRLTMAGVIETPHAESHQIDGSSGFAAGVASYAGLRDFTETIAAGS
jgi:hypothetical protein